MTDLPADIIPSRVPSRERLDELTEDELIACINWYRTRYVSLGLDFWMNELDRRRMQRVLDAIAGATAENARHVAAGAEQNSEMVSMNRTMVTLTKASVLLAGAAVVVAVIALVAA